ncbi:hypothetical protein BC830DRAFT_1168199 [Chytriomyces sp. MP71]|nr:hypothetical protein BC830DRAFT_1168199 [Chytriomyces sp. MP71]
MATGFLVSTVPGEGSFKPSPTGASEEVLVSLLDRYAFERKSSEWNPDSESESSRDEQDVDTESARSRSRSPSLSSSLSRRRDDKSTETQLDSFLMLLAISLQEYGCPTAVLEAHMNDVAIALNRPAKFSFFNGYAFASWNQKDGSARTQLFGDWSNLDVYKLQLCDELARHVASYSKPESNARTRSRKLSVVSIAGGTECADTVEPTLSVRKTWARTLLRYLGGTLYGVKLSLAEDGAEAANPHLDSTVVANTDETPEMEKGAITQSQLAEQILYLASAGPAVQTQIKEALRKQKSTLSVPAVELDQIPDGPQQVFDTECLDVNDAIVSADGKEERPSCSSMDTLPQPETKTVNTNAHLPRIIESTKSTTSLTSLRHRAAAATQRTKHRARPKIKPTLRRTKTQHIKLFMSIAASDALARIKQIRDAPSPYPSWLSVGISGLSSAGCAAIFFGGGWWDLLASFVLGTVVGGLAKLSARLDGLERVYEFLSAFVVGFFCRLLVVWDLPICTFATTISSIIQIVQGTNITLSIMELASKHPGAGVSRLAYSLTVTALIGIGLEFGAALASRISNNQSQNLTTYTTCANALPLNIQWAIYPPTLLVFLIDLNAHPRQFFFMALVSTIAQLVYVYTSPTLQDPLASFVAAFAMGAASHIYSHVTMSNPIVGVLAGLQVLVPGTLAVRAFASNDVTSGVDLAASVLVIALSLGLGLFLGSAVAGRGGGFLRKGRLADRNHVLAI